MNPPKSKAKDTKAKVNLTSNLSNIPQLDGGISFTCTNISDTTENESILDDSNVTSYNTEDEVEADTTPVNSTPPTKPSKRKYHKPPPCLL